MNKLRFLSILALSVVCFMACQKEKTMVAPPFLSEPIAKLAPQFQFFDIDATKGDTLLLANGSRIRIPRDAFVDTTGAVVKGAVKLKYREMHNALDVFLSGAPMDYDSAGRKMLMETAGMFEIRAAAGEQVLKLASDKNIEVRLASFTDGNEYSFYQLDETQKNWSYKGTARPEVNEKRAIVESQIASLSKSPVFPFTSDYFALSVGSMLDLMLNNDYSRISANKNRNIVIDKAKAYGFAVYDISGWANVKFGPDYYYTGEILWYKKGGLQLPTWTKKSCNVSEANALGNKMYELTILEDVDKNPRSTKIRAQAYLPLRYVLKSKPEKWQSDYDAIMKKISDKEHELVVTASVFRTFNISALGFCNWDQLKDLGQPLELAANFDWGQESDADELPYVYYFVNQHKTYVRIAPQEWAHIKLADDSTAFFVAVISPETIAVFDNAAYRQIDFAKLRSAQTRELQFPMKTQSATTRATLEALLQETKKGQGR